MPAGTLADCDVRGGGWKSPGDTNNFLASLSVSRAAMVSALTSLGLERAGVTLRVQMVFEQVCSGSWRTETAELAHSCLRLSLGVFLLHQTVFPSAGGEQGAGVQVMPDKDPEQAGDHDDHSARGNDPGHCDTDWHRRQHPQHHRSVLFLQERVAFDRALLRALVSQRRVLGRRRRGALRAFSCTFSKLLGKLHLTFGEWHPGTFFSLHFSQSCPGFGSCLCGR